MCGTVYISAIYAKRRMLSLQINTIQSRDKAIFINQTVCKFGIF